MCFPEGSGTGGDGRVPITVKASASVEGYPSEGEVETILLYDFVAT